MTANEIRKKYLDFFKAKGHKIIPSASLAPENDSSILFTNSGMSPLVPYLLGEKHPLGVCLTNSQKCFRAEDMEEVGDNRHTTFFEMLGNWSLGDPNTSGDVGPTGYFKEEQLNWWFEFLLEELKLDPKRIYQTVYGGDGKIAKDEESIVTLKKIYKKYGLSAEEGPATTGKGEFGPGVEIDFKRDKIFAYVDKNWWQRGQAVGELGGPDSETFFDTQKEHDKKFGQFCHLNCDCGRFIEIGNSVFMQYQKTESGWELLKNKNVDFGGGLERLAVILQKKNDIFETDLFQPIIEKIKSQKSKVKNISQNSKVEEIKAERIIADHIKASVFILAERIGPSNLGQGYVLRRLIRRAIRYGKMLGIQNNFLSTLALPVIKIYENIYPELKREKDFILKELACEEECFNKTLERGLKEFEKLSSQGISGQEAFNLYQTYGLPIEMIEEMAKEKDIVVDLAGFEEALKKHQDLSRTASAGQFKAGLADTSEQTTKYHTTCHLLLAGLREVLKQPVEQRGSNITAERIRFDFSFDRKLTPEEIKQVEDWVNQKIDQKLDIVCQEMLLEKAIEKGAMASFREKYPEVVKVYSVCPAEQGEGGVVSREICSGPHIKNTQELGKFKIIKEEASSRGVRRIKAVLQ